MQNQAINLNRAATQLSRALRRAAVAFLALAFILLHNHKALAQDNDSPSPSQTASACGLNFGDGKFYEWGLRPQVAMNASGLVVEVHESSFTGAGEISYKVGQINGSAVNWGKSYVVPLSFASGHGGYYPAVALTKSGLVILAFQYYNGRANPNQLYYMVGQLDVNGGSDQRILWLTGAQLYDAGNRVSLSVNDNGLIVGVHETGSGGNGLYYRIGQLPNPPQSYSIKWTSGEYGIRYTGGVFPHIAINNQNQVVEVHQVQDNENLLHYIRGTISAPYSSVKFANDQPRYDNNAANPTDALLDSGMVIEAHTAKLGSTRLGSMWAQLNPSDPVKLNWGCSSSFSPTGDDRAYPQVAANGNTAIMVTFGVYPYGSQLWSYVAKY